METCKKIRKAKGIIFICLLSLSLHSCALLTSYRKFSLERTPENTFDHTQTFYDGNGSYLNFYEDGTCLLINISSRKLLEQHLEHINYKIYGRLSDNLFHWGIYKIGNNMVQIEFLEKTDQWGFMGITKWYGFLKEQELEIQSGPVNKNRRLHYAPTFTSEGMMFYPNNDLRGINIQPEKAWVNK